MMNDNLLVKLDIRSHVKPGVSKRSDFPLIPSKSALLVIDVQDHLSSGNKDEYLFSTALPQAIPNMVKLVEGFRSIRDDDGNQTSNDNDFNSNKCEVIFTYLESKTKNNRDISLDYKLSGPNLSTFLPNVIRNATFHTIPHSLRPNATTGHGDVVLPKTSCSVFASTNIHYILQNLNVEQLIICGQLTDQCVLSAVRDAADIGYFVSVVEDACAALSNEDHERGVLGMQGFARVMKTDDVMKEINVNYNPYNDQIIDMKELVSPSVIEPYSHCEPSKILSLPSIKTWQPKESISSYNEAIVHVLQYANVKFLRYVTIDISSSIRTKVIPVQKWIKDLNRCHSVQLYDQTSIAKICMGGMTHHADRLVPGTNLDAKHVLIIQPDISTLRILPYTSSSAIVFGTLHHRKEKNIIVDGVKRCNDNVFGEVSEYCTRSILQRVVKTAKDELGIGFAVGVEIEFILVRRRKTSSNQRDNQNVLDVVEPVDSTVFASTTTLNQQDAFINDVYDCLMKQNIEIETLHSESSPGQMEIVLPHQSNVLKLADMIVLTKETIKECARKQGLTALFLPKVFENSAGNGMHVHLSIFSIHNPKENIFPSSQSSSISLIGQSFLEGILSHLKGLLSLTMPSINSFRRVGVGCWTGHSISWMVEDKESPLRVCLDLSSSKATNVEFKLIDNSCNIYLALAGIIFAGMNGIHKSLKLRPMTSSNGDDKMKNTGTLPQSLEDTLNHLSDDPIFMTLLGRNLLSSYIAVKREEVKQTQSLAEEVKDVLTR